MINVTISFTQQLTQILITILYVCVHSLKLSSVMFRRRRATIDVTSVGGVRRVLRTHWRTSHICFASCLSQGNLVEAK